MWLKKDEGSCPLGKARCDADCDWCLEPEQNVLFYTINGPSPLWKRAAGINTRDIVYLPAAMTGGNEKIAALLAYCEGVLMTLFRDHAYLPVSWIKKERPMWATKLEALEQKIIKIHNLKSSRGRAIRLSGREKGGLRPVKNRHLAEN